MVTVFAFADLWFWGIILTEQTASTYYDHFQPPTDEEGEVIVVEGY